MSADAGAAAASPAVVGPNAVIQLGKALDDLFGHPAARAVFLKGGHPELLTDPPQAMIQETIPAALLAGLWQTFEPEDACTVTAEAGRRTADYVIAHRIPKPVKWLLSHLPRPLSGRLLLNAIRRNAWTFCGSGQCRTERSPTLAIVLIGNPLATPQGTWHAAVFARLFHRLVSEEVDIVYRLQAAAPPRVERFEIALR